MRPTCATSGDKKARCIRAAPTAMLDARCPKLESDYATTRCTQKTPAGAAPLFVSLSCWFVAVCSLCLDVDYSRSTIYPGMGRLEMFSLHHTTPSIPAACGPVHDAQKVRRAQMRTQRNATRTTQTKSQSDVSAVNERTEERKGKETKHGRKEGKEGSNCPVQSDCTCTSLCVCVHCMCVRACVCVCVCVWVCGRLSKRDGQSVSVRQSVSQSVR